MKIVTNFLPKVVRVFGEVKLNEFWPLKKLMADTIGYSGIDIHGDAVVSRGLHTLMATQACTG